ncbi:VVA0879 family protein [Diaphorobacter caeni]|uniref:VVA0879 family protein n=1 Tax=Diaphorobacter caeni TaxID=2784387 RepID=UPI00189076CB|nr:VVA0879 family protein [Diaphorobacter caeni]MBF5006891.1 hypothetical protein [Diaphorobacter caeni]
MKTMTLQEFQAACQAQASNREQIVFRCPMCGTMQSAQQLIAAGAGADFGAVERYLGFSCIGRFTGAESPRRDPDGRPCNWTLGGLLQTHRMEVVTTDGKHHPHFELATNVEAEMHRAALAGSSI